LLGVTAKSFLVGFLGGRVDTRDTIAVEIGVFTGIRIGFSTGIDLGIIIVAIFSSPVGSSKFSGKITEIVTIKINRRNVVADELVSKVLEPVLRVLSATLLKRGDPVKEFAKVFTVESSREKMGDQSIIAVEDTIKSGRRTSGLSIGDLIVSCGVSSPILRDFDLGDLISIVKSALSIGTDTKITADEFRNRVLDQSADNFWAIGLHDTITN